MSEVDYYEYIKSDEWHDLAELRKRIDGYKCQLCGSAMNLNVHHVTYERLGCEDITDIITVCRKCHEDLHKADRTERKRARWFTEYLEDVQMYDKDLNTAMFAATVWPKFCVNGGDLNLLDIANVMSPERRKFCERTGLSEYDVRIMHFHDFCNRYVNLLVLEGMFKGETVKESAMNLHLKESNIQKRRRELMKIGNWTTVDAATIGGGAQLEAGGYVVMIQKVEDHPADGYLDLVIDVAEGENAFMYAGLPASDDWRHTYRRYYEGGAEPFFKQFLEALEISNRGKFNIAAWEQRCDEREFVGLELGVIFQKRLYTKKSGKNKGKDGWSLNWFASIPAQDIRNGDFTVPADADEREKKAAPGPGVGAYDDDIDL